MTGRIKLSEGFEAERDQYGWTLIEHYEGTSKEGQPLPKEYKTYYASLAQCCEAVADRKAGECPNTLAVMAMWREFIDEIKDVTRGVK